MQSSAATRALQAERERTRLAQATAADPAVSAWVAANAGTGKTHVLTMRTLRLLLAGTSPERILCLTYTKAAAAEMSKRVFDALAHWVTAPPPQLGRQLTELLGRAPTADETQRARRLFTAAIETPGGLKVQTIHAFCERLLQRFPLEAGVPPHFTILDDDGKRGLVREAIDGVLMAATRERQVPLGRALDTVVTWAAEDAFDELLTEAMAKSDWLEAMSRQEGGFDAATRFYAEALGVTAGMRAGDYDDALAGVLSDGQLRRAIGVLGVGSKTDRDIAGGLTDAIAAGSTTVRIEALKTALLTKEGEPRSDNRFVTKALREAEPGLYDLLITARDRFAALIDEQRRSAVVEATVALLRLADAALQGYQDAKTRSAALDFDDLVRKSARLLGDHAMASWVHYKLDGGLDHILVDEAQDTSPVQWRLIGSLAEEFFAGSGARDEVRTIFAVGDKKQSIYSFQGAEPRKFRDVGEAFGEAALLVGAAWRDVPLTLSFRTVAPLLDSVDRVFADPARTPGLADTGEHVGHAADRAGHAGLVEVWTPERPAETAPDAADGPAETPPPKRLALRIADTIRGWLDQGERLASADRPIRAGDIIILVRKRNPFAAPMVAALEARGIRVAGADRMVLTEALAVQDLVTLGDFLLLPEDDLALATVLKSPLFDLDDDDLLRLAPGRKGSLWRALLAAAALDPRYGAAGETLKRWRQRADFMPPYEFLSTLLGADGMRARLLARLGPEAADPLDELLDLAMAYDEENPPSLQGFLVWLAAGKREIKRDMEHGRDEVRVMTVHGAKGLEAPIVFLPDTCSARSGRQGSLVPFDGFNGARPMGLTPVPTFVWPVKGTSKLEPIAAAKGAVAAAEREERNRLLYVAMTRARDRLYVCGFEGKQKRDKACWYDLVREALAPVLREAIAPDGATVWRYESPQTAPTVPVRGAAIGAMAARPLPAWATRPAPREPQLVVPLAPSRLAPLEVDETGEPVEAAAGRATAAEPPAAAPARATGASRFLRGTLTHALLEHLPELDPETWERVAPAFVAARGGGLPPGVQAGIVAETLAILRHPTFAPLFGPKARAEVPIVADIEPPGGGRTLRVTGEIDRLAVIGQEVLIVDYKTNRPPPEGHVGVPEAYLLQLAAYRMAVTRIFHNFRVRAAILWTDGARIVEIPHDDLDRAERRLMQIAVSELDAAAGAS